MDIRNSKNTVLVFDLDDTLYNEIDYAISAFLEIAQVNDYQDQSVIDGMIYELRNGGDAYHYLIKKYGRVKLSLEEFLVQYRNHVPQISLDKVTRLFLKVVKQKEIVTGLITDGRSHTQRNKLKSLGLSDYFDRIIISQEFGSEKPCTRNFLSIQEDYPKAHFIYFADNPAKDFVGPNELGWRTVMLVNNGRNIHNQQLNEFPVKNHPFYKIHSFAEINIFD